MIKVAVLGYGVVGGGVIDVLEENFQSIAHNAGDEISVKYILTRRDFPDSEHKGLMVQDFAIIENDPEVKIVVEVMGGAGAAYDYTRRSLLAGKSVVTANKELVATYGHELLEIAEEKNVNYLFEASVGGGIPIIRPITQCLAANEIDEVYGILNGTTNYILTQMIKYGTSFEDALADAQEKGYAEADPSADVDGIDACRKICILADLCFGKHVAPSAVSTRGITKVDLADVTYAKAMGYKIKLLGRAMRTGSDTATAYVAPHLIKNSSLLSNVDGVMNGIVVHGNAIGEAMFYGAGAGKRPTASAVVADIIDSVRHIQHRKFLNWELATEHYVSDSDDLVMPWYVRVRTSLATIGEALGNVRFITRRGAPLDEYAFVTEPMSHAELLEKLLAMEVLSHYRILD